MKDFSSSRSLSIHLETIHLKTIKFSCDICPFTSAQKVNLETHVARVHNDEVKDSQCPDCGKYFRKYDLKNHINRVHTTKRFQCSQCVFAAKSKKYLLEHEQAIHLNLKIDCPYCDHKASTRTNLRTHIKSLHEHMKFKCNECEKE